MFYLMCLCCEMLCSGCRLAATNFETGIIWKGKKNICDSSIIKALHIDPIRILEPTGLGLSPLIIQKLRLETIYKYLS